MTSQPVEWETIVFFFITFLCCIERLTTIIATHSLPVRVGGLAIFFLLEKKIHLILLIIYEKWTSKYIMKEEEKNAFLFVFTSKSIVEGEAGLP